MTYWMEIATRTIRQVDEQLAQGVSLAERMRAVDAAYPFSVRRCWPYKAWLKARRAYLCSHGYVPRNARNPLPLFYDISRDPTTGLPMLETMQ